MSRPLEHLTESAGRWLAARTTRRSFIANAGRAAIVATGGSAVAAVFASRAEARVCGQSGVSPKCPTYDCDAPGVWGWCWYANGGCCADGGIKKICDCCRAGHPNVHGYCPEGSNVYCIVESCLEDPRVMKLQVQRHAGSTAVLLGLLRSQRTAGGTVRIVVVGDGDDPLMAALAAPVAADLAAPLVLSHGAQLVGPVRDELVRLGATRYVLVGSNHSAAVVSALRELGTVEHIGSAPGVAAASVQVAAWLLARSPRPQVFCIGAGSLSTAVAASVASLAALRRAPVLVSPDAVATLRAAGESFSATFVTDEVGSPGAARATGDEFVRGSDAVAISRMLSGIALADEPRATFALVLSPVSGVVPSFGLVAPGSVTVLHGDAAFDPGLRTWLDEARGRLTRIEVATDARGSLSADGIYQVQSAANGFNAHLLVGTDGQGLPVVVQPMEERTLGKARVAGPLPTTTRPPVVARLKPGPIKK